MKYFTWKELTRSSKNLPNIPNYQQKKNIEYLVDHLLDPVREKLGKPIIVTSCFRSEQVNKAVGGAKTSQHMANNGAAADLKCYNNSFLFQLIKNNFEFDQMIWEFGDLNQPSWVHVSLKEKNNRKQILRAEKIKGKTVYKPIY